MRCSKCGFDNPEGVNACVKCGQTIQGNAGSYLPLRATVVSANSQDERPGYTPRPTVIATPDGYANPMRATVLDKQDVGFDSQARQTRVIGNDSFSKTSDTHKEQAVDTSVKCQYCQAEIRADYAFCPMCGKPIEHPTMPEGPKCSLTVIPEEDEQIEETTLTYVGEVIVLNRDNTDRENRTITSKEQAVLLYKDEKWYIENRSEYCTTYIEASRSFEIRSGDVIMLGDRRFRFDAEQ